MFNKKYVFEAREFIVFNQIFCNKMQIRNKEWVRERVK